MSTARQKTRKTPPARTRINITLDPTAHRLGTRLAKAERRSFSNLLEILIEREAGRVGEKGAQ